MGLISGWQIILSYPELCFWFDYNPPRSNELMCDAYGWAKFGSNMRYGPTKLMHFLPLNHWFLGVNHFEPYPHGPLAYTSRAGFLPVANSRWTRMEYLFCVFSVSGTFIWCQYLGWWTEGCIVLLPGNFIVGNLCKIRHKLYRSQMSNYMQSCVFVLSSWSFPNSNPIVFWECNSPLKCQQCTRHPHP